MIGRKQSNLLAGDVVKIKGDNREFILGAPDIIYPLYDCDGNFYSVREQRTLEFIRVSETDELSTISEDDELAENTTQE